MANLTGLGLVETPFRSTIGLALKISDDTTITSYKSFFDALVQQKTIRHAMNVSQILDAVLICPIGAGAHIHVHELSKPMDDGGLERELGPHGLATCYAGAFLNGLFGSPESLERCSTRTGRNALRIVGTGEWLIWFWQPDRKCWYIQLTRGKSEWHPGDRIVTEFFPTVSSQAA